MQCLHQLRNGRCVISCSILSVCLVVEDCACGWSSFLQTHPLPLCFRCSSNFSCSTSSTSPILVTETSFPAQFSNFLLQRSRISSASLFTRVLLLSCARVLEKRVLLSHHSDTSFVDDRTHGGQRSLDVSVQELRVALLALRTNSSFASPST